MIPVLININFDGRERPQKEKNMMTENTRRGVTIVGGIIQLFIAGLLLSCSSSPNPAFDSSPYGVTFEKVVEMPDNSFEKLFMGTNRWLGTMKNNGMPGMPVPGRDIMEVDSSDKKSGIIKGKCTLGEIYEQSTQSSQSESQIISETETETRTEDGRKRVTKTTTEIRGATLDDFLGRVPSGRITSEFTIEVKDKRYRISFYQPYFETREIRSQPSPENLVSAKRKWESLADNLKAFAR
ncbi:MAG: hypothetical protein LBT68_07615 [Spirochaetales bacterium]|jgi:hypothetical protein|nr:hypothetical protein [Spirochaetales bacterium]